MRRSRVNRSLSRIQAVQPAASPLNTCGPAPRRKPPGSHCALPRSEIPPPTAALGPADKYRSALDSSPPARLLKCAVCRFSGQQTHDPFRRHRDLSPVCSAGIRPCRRRGPPPTRTSVDAAAGTEPGGEQGERPAAVDALAVMMQDLLTQNHASSRQNKDLMNQVRRLLCEKANLLAQVRPPACPVPFPETFTGDTARLPEFLTQAVSYEVLSSRPDSRTTP